MENLTIKKNDTLVVDIIDLTYEGLGVAKVEGYPLFIENTLPGEVAEIVVIKIGKTFGFGKLIKLQKKSLDRVELKDKQLTATGIAPLQHLSYSGQLAFKQKQVENVMEKIAKMPEITILPMIGMEEPYGYRNKAQIPVREIDGKLATGFFRKNSHDLVPIENYYIQDPKIDEAIKVVADIMRRFSVKPYDEKENTGSLRHIIVRRGHYSHEMMIVLVTRTEKLFKKEVICEQIINELPEVISIIQNVNPEQTNVILGRKMIPLAGKEYIKDTLMEKTYQISPKSFYQVNSIQAEILYQTAIDFAELKATDVVIDAYSGIGTIALSLADKVKQVYGIESIKDAVIDAKANAALNNIENVKFKVGKAEILLKEWADEEMHCDVLVVDPPRKGLAKFFIDAVLEMKPKKMIYISCNPATFARDLRLLADGGYNIEKIQPVDMFPQTTHVESIILLQMKNS